MDYLLDRYLDTRCEVKTMDNDLLLIGRVSRVLESPAKDESALSVDIVADDGEFMPSIAFGTPVKLVFASKSSGILIIRGQTYLMDKKFWRINNIIQNQSAERRQFFRVSFDNKCMVALEVESEMGTETPAYDAQLVDLSLSGIRFLSEHRFSESDHLWLSDLVLVEREAPFSLRCKIRHTPEKSPQGMYTYRCSFEDLDERETDRLCKAIFAQQSKLIRKRRQHT